MNTGRLRTAVAFAAALLPATTIETRADTIPTRASIAGQTALFSYSPFDPTFVSPLIPTLNEVDVMISGEFLVNVNTAPNVIVINYVPVYIPYDFNVSAALDFGSILGSGFTTTFYSPFDFMGSGFADGIGEAETVVIPFTYDFSFDSSTDLAGGSTVATNGDMEAALLDDFLPPPGNQPILQNFVVLAQPAGGDADAAIGDTIIDASVNAGIFVSYDYTLSSPPTAVPEPSSLALVGAGLAGFGLIRRRRQSKHGRPGT